MAPIGIVMIDNDLDYRFDVDNFVVAVVVNRRLHFFVTIAFASKFHIVLHIFQN